MLRDLSAATRSKAGSYDHGQKGNKGKRDMARRDNPKQRDSYYTGAYNAYKKPRQAGGRGRVTRATSATVCVRFCRRAR